MAIEYTIDFTDPNKGTLTLPPLEIDGPESTISSSLDITLIGDSHVKWGEYILENMVHMLENFACPSIVGTEIPDTSTSIFALNNPTEGQLWFNTTNKQTYSFDGINWNMLGDIEFSGSPPSSPTYEGKLWYDITSYTTDSSEYGRNLKIFDGSTYKEVVDDYLPRDGSKKFLGNIEFSSAAEIIFDSTGGGTIRNLSSPVLVGDATNKQYVDTELNKKITKAGDTDIGSLNFLSNATLSFSATTGGQVKNLISPTDNADATNKQYVDNLANTKLSLNGTTPMVGNLNMNNAYRVINLPNPTANTHAANKQYVDSGQSWMQQRSLGNVLQVGVENINIYSQGGDFSTGPETTTLRLKPWIGGYFKLVITTYIANGSNNNGYYLRVYANNTLSASSYYGDFNVGDKTLSMSVAVPNRGTISVTVQSGDSGYDNKSYGVKAVYLYAAQEPVYVNIDKPSWPRP